jgi:hypothetical protein
MKAGTRIEIRGWDPANHEVWEAATIGRVQKFMLPLLDGYHPITFTADGAKVLCHESGFRVIDNQ